MRSPSLRHKAMSLTGKRGVLGSKQRDQMVGYGAYPA